MESEPGAHIAYIVKGFPRLSETFIANEIHLLESMGLELRIYSIMRGEDSKVHDVITRIRAPVTYLPQVTSLSGCSFISWLYHNLPAFVPAHRRLMAKRPWAYLATLGAAFAMSWRYRLAPLARPKKVFFKEFLQAGQIAMQVLEGGGVRHLHGHYCHGAATITWFASRLTGLPFSFTAHAKDIYKSDLNPGNLLRRKMMAAQFVATCTAANHRHLAQICPDYRALHTIYHGLDTDYFAPQREPDSAAVPLILSVGRFVEKKGFDYLVAACAQLKASGVDFRCWLVGPPGNHSARIREMIEMLRVADVVSIRDAMTQDELRRVYQQASIFVLPCLQLEDGDRDGIPNVLAEAMATGIPVISTSISGIPELIDDGTDGLLVPERDSLSLAGALRRLVESPKLRRQLSEAGRRKVCRNFDSRRTTVRLAELFAATIRRARPTPDTG
jgi:glycosyltransferase involved in cell wall biosynthesis